MKTAKRFQLDEIWEQFLVIFCFFGAMFCIVTLFGCAQSGGGGTPAAAAKNVTTPVSTPTPTPAPTTAQPVSSSPTPTPVVTIDPTYYSKTTTQGIPGGYVNFTGYCVVYQSETYCWDDGEKLVTGSYCSFWQVSNFVHTMCSSTTKPDSLSVPKIVSANMLAQMTPNLGGVTPSQILSTGTPKDVTCTLSGNILNCVDFLIDLSQTPL